MPSSGGSSRESSPTVSDVSSIGRDSRPEVAITKRSHRCGTAGDAGAFTAQCSSSCCCAGLLSGRGPRMVKAASSRSQLHRVPPGEPDTGPASYLIASSSSRQACSQRRQASAHTRQCSCILACRSHSSPQLLQGRAAGPRGSVEPGDWCPPVHQLPHRSVRPGQGVHQVGISSRRQLHRVLSVDPDTLPRR